MVGAWAVQEGCVEAGGLRQYVIHMWAVFEELSVDAFKYVPPVFACEGVFGGYEYLVVGGGYATEGFGLPGFALHRGVCAVYSVWSCMLGVVEPG